MQCALVFKHKLKPATSHAQAQRQEEILRTLTNWSLITSVSKDPSYLPYYASKEKIYLYPIFYSFNWISCIMQITDTGKISRLHKITKTYQSNI